MGERQMIGFGSEDQLRGIVFLSCRTPTFAKLRLGRPIPSGKPVGVNRHPAFVITFLCDGSRVPACLQEAWDDDKLLYYLTFLSSSTLALIFDSAV